MSTEATYLLLRHLARTPAHSQRSLANELDISLGKVNYCLRALLDKGYVKAIKFKDCKHKSRYLYKLTPAGLNERSRAARHFLVKKQREYEVLAAEIERLRKEVGEC